jgi:glycosyltransferase involved in cell wall biosynthesis
MRVLHLAFEDHLRPGSGGGSLRNREINARLAAMGHEIDVVAANYPDARTRVEDGVHYRHYGLRRGYAPSLISHQLCLPAIVGATMFRRPPDVIVEEFAPLASSLGVGNWTSRPSVGVAQGFFAEEKARQYRLPPHALLAVQGWGTRSHDQLVAVSEDVKRQLLAVAPAKEVTVIPNGVDQRAADQARRHAATRSGSVLLFLGRLEIQQKGLDVLVKAMSQVTDGMRLLIAGEGKDRERVQDSIRGLGLEDRVALIGAVHGEAKWRLIAEADLVLQPSRYETFGISVLEAMACGTPVVASDLTCLRELLPPSAGIRVPVEDPDALATAVNVLMAAPSRRRAMQEAGPTIARRYEWDAIARSQATVYARAQAMYRREPRHPSYG